MTPPQLELFRHSATVVHLSISATASAWLAALGAFSSLRELRLQRSNKLKDSHLQHLEPLAPTLRVLDLSGCSNLTGLAAQHLGCLTSLDTLDLSATSLDEGAVLHLAEVLSRLTSLSCAELDVGDSACQALSRLSAAAGAALHGGC